MTAFFIFLSVITGIIFKQTKNLGGLFYLIMRWELKLKIAFLYKKCMLKKATHLLVYSLDYEQELVKISIKNAPINGVR